MATFIKDAEAEGDLPGEQLDAVSAEEVQEGGKPKDRHGLVGFMQDHKMEFMLSVALHAGVLFLMIVLSTIEAEAVKPEVSVIQKVEEPPPEPPPKKLEQKEPELKEVEVKETEVTDTEEKVDVPVEQPVDQPETETAGSDEQSDLKAIMAGTTGEVSDVPEGIVGPGGVGYGSPDGGGLPHGYKSRAKGGKSGAMRKHGGGGTEPIVELSLKWLKYHQEPDGSWDAKKYEGSRDCKPAATALALLAFLGAGYSETIGPYKDTVHRGIVWLTGEVEKAQRPWFDNGYGTGMVLMALSEATIFGSSGRTRTSANRVAKCVLDSYQGDGFGYGGAGTDQSVSGWIALGLKSAKAADLEALGPGNAEQAKKFFEDYKKKVDFWADDTNGKGGYSGKGNGGDNMMFVSMFQKMFMGAKKDDVFLVKASDNMLKVIAADRYVGGEKPGDVYGVYYGTLSSFQRQDQVWKAWNAKMKPTLMNSQRKGDPQLMGGSWDPTEGHTGGQGGRVLTTALLCLCLEVYYRYEVMN